MLGTLEVQQVPAFSEFYALELSRACLEEIRYEPVIFEVAAARQRRCGNLQQVQSLDVRQHELMSIANPMLAMKTRN